MPAISPALTAAASQALTSLGEAVRRRRKALGINATATAEAAGISRVTLYRIEKGEPSVTMGAYMAACAALGLQPRAEPPAAAEAAAMPARKGWIPAKVRIADYPKLGELAWQVQGTAELTPGEALDVYERNWRHLDPATLGEDERDLVEALRIALGSDARV
jgi:transcriptional regulator with XRE-family HTH domain